MGVGMTHQSPADRSTVIGLDQHHSVIRKATSVAPVAQILGDIPRDVAAPDQQLQYPYAHLGLDRCNRIGIDAGRVKS